MLKTLAKIFGGLVALAVLAAGGLVAALALGWARRYELPEPTITASADRNVIERGRYLVYGPAACAYCHRPKADWPRLAAGEEPPLSGGHEFPMPFGAIFSANLTSDRATGIGGTSDGAIARLIRYGVRSDGHAAVPLMEFQNLSDEDLTAVLSFLRTQPPVAHSVPPHRLTMFGKLLVGVLIGPLSPTATPPLRSPTGPTIERGRYLANDVASCVNCHTERGGKGELVGARFAGGQRMEFAADPTRVLVTPNLTPDPETGRIAAWTEEGFLVRFRSGPVIPETIMPWGAYGHMTDDDLLAIYRYLRTLPPTHHDTGPSVQPRT